MILTSPFASIFNLYFSSAWGGRPLHFVRPTDAGNARVQMEAGFCPSSVSWIQMTFPLVISFECHRFSFGPVQLIRPRKPVALWSFSLHCTVAKKSAVSLLLLKSLWGCSPTAGTVHPVLFCLLMRHALQNGLLCGWNQTALSKCNSSIKLKWNIWTWWKQNVFLLFFTGEFRKKVNSFSVVESASGGALRGKGSP